MAKLSASTARFEWRRDKLLAKSVLRPTDEDSVREAKTLLRTARFGTLAVLDPADGSPLVSRVAVACDSDGAPLILVSGLSAHTAALQSDPRSSLLVGEPGKGDALAYPRLSVRCLARPPTDEAEKTRCATRFLRHVPKAALYAELPDFRYFRLEPQSGAMNGGFGKAYALQASDLLTENGFSLADFETALLNQVNEGHADAVRMVAERLAGKATADWKLTGIDPEGVNMAAGDETARVWFNERVESQAGARAMLVALLEKGRDPALGRLPQ